MDLAEQLRDDIREFKKTSGADAPGHDAGADPPKSSSSPPPRTNP